MAVGLGIGTSSSSNTMSSGGTTGGFWDEAFLGGTGGVSVISSSGGVTCSGAAVFSVGFSAEDVLRGGTGAVRGFG